MLPLGSINVLTVQRYVVVSLSSHKRTCCKSLWMKASAQRPECKRTCLRCSVVEKAVWNWTVVPDGTSRRTDIGNMSEL